MNATLIVFRSTFQTNMDPAANEATVHLERNHIAQDMDIVHSHRTMVSKAVKTIAPNQILQNINS